MHFYAFHNYSLGITSRVSENNEHKDEVRISSQQETEVKYINHQKMKTNMKVQACVSGGSVSPTL